MTITRTINGIEVNIALTKEEIGEAHKEHVTAFMAKTLMDDFEISEDDAGDLAVRAYEIYEEGELTEYECIEQAHSEYPEGD